MLRQASVSDLIMERVSRDTAYIVITMRRYPRFVNRRLRDEYLNCMSPDPDLFEDWLSAKRRGGSHNAAFPKSKFETRFRISAAGLGELERLSALAEKRDVFLICSCKTGERCHRELVLMAARRLYKANAELPRNDFPIFAKRLRGRKKDVIANLLLPEVTKKKPRRII